MKSLDSFSPLSDPGIGAHCKSNNLFHSCELDPHRICEKIDLLRTLTLMALSMILIKPSSDQSLFPHISDHKIGLFHTVWTPLMLWGTNTD